MPELQEWKFDPKEILSSKRKVKGIFHKSVIDKDNEFITPDAIKKSIPDYMHLPALHDFHKERPVGLATKIWQEKDGSFGFEGVIKSTEDCDDIWEKISKGNYDHVSIFGRRTEGNQNCSLPQGLRTGPCITNGVRLDSISVCDDNARNDYTSLSVKKAQLIWDGMDMIQKAETAGESNLMHTPTDYAKEEKCPCSKKKYKVSEISKDVEKGLPSIKMPPEQAHNWRAAKKELKNNPTIKRWEEEDIEAGMKLHKGDDMEEDVEKGTVKENRAGRGELRGTKLFHDYRAGKDYVSSGHGQEGYSRKESIAQRNDRMGPKEEKAEVEKGEKWSQKEKNEAFDKLEQKKPGTAADYRQHERGGEKGKRQYFNKGDEEDDDMSDEEAPQEMEKGQWEGGEAEVHSHDIRHRGKTTTGSKKRSPGGEAEFKEHDTSATSKPAPKKEKKREPTSGVKYDKMEKGDVSEEDADDDNQYDEESDSSKKKVSPKDKEGNWAKDQPGGSNIMKKGEKEQEIDTETRGEDAKEEMDEEDEDDDEEMEKSRPGNMMRGKRELAIRSKNKDYGPVENRGQADAAAHSDQKRSPPYKDTGKRFNKNSDKYYAVKKGDTMEEDEEVSQEYVTKAMVPIEEVDTIIKARTEEISKAYTAQFDEIKKAYDAKIAELSTRVDKMSEEVIRKGGSIVVIPQLLDPNNQGFMSNADAFAKMTAGK